MATRSPRLLAVVVGAAAVAAFGQPSAAPKLAIVNVTVVDATGQPPLAGRTVLVRDGRIQSDRKSVV